MPRSIHQASSLSQLAASVARLPQGDLVGDHRAAASALGRLTIVTKDRGNAPFVVNPAQADALAKITALPRDRQRKVIVLKARQLGFSTLIQGRGYTLLRSQPNYRVVTISHQGDATERLYSKSTTFLAFDLAKPPMKRNRTGAMEFADTGGSHYIGTAGSKTFGRGDTIQYIHASEVAFWDDPATMMTGLLQALTPDGEVYAESTPNGIGGWFHGIWQEAPQNGWLPLFYPWWWEPGYRIAVPDPDELLPLREDEADLVARHGLDLEQIAWRRDKILTLKHFFLQEYPEDPETCFLSSGLPYFDGMVLRDIGKRTIMEPIYEDRGLRVWQDPVPGREYVVGADVSEGLTGGDFSVATVLDAASGEQVAKLRGLWPISHFSHRVADLAERYNRALLAPERNNHGHACLAVLLNEVKYENVYRHEEYNARMGEVQRKWGWPTTTTSKPVMLSDLDSGLTNGTVIVRDVQTLSELRTMHWNGKGGVEAVSGCHDDDVMALAIANQIRKVPQRFAAAMDYFTPNPYLTGELDPWADEPEEENPDG
jgi:hypothetical protein